jgi:hypothetical protein
MSACFGSLTENSGKIFLGEHVYPMPGRTMCTITAHPVIVYSTLCDRNFCHLDSGNSEYPREGHFPSFTGSLLLN